MNAALTQESQMSSPRWGRIFGAAAIVGALVTIPVVAFAAGGPAHGCHRGPEPKSTADIREHLAMGADHMLDKVDATDAQRDEVDALLDTLAPELWSFKTEHEGIHDDFQAALTAETVDRAKLESVRVRGLALADKASGVLIDSIADTAEILTVDQRGELLDLWERWQR